MNPASQSKLGKRIGMALSILIVAAALVLGAVVTGHVNRYPRTDDAEIVANFIGIAPQVEGPILRLNVRDNQFVKQGDLLFEIDDRPYRYALEKAISDQATLEGQISDEQRRIAALVSAVSVSQANIQGTEADVTRSAAAVDQAHADVANAEQGVSRAQAEWAYANNNLHRIEPLLVKQFVTVDQVDRARTLEVAQEQALKQAQSQLRLSQAGLQATLAQEERTRAMLEQSKAQHEQSQHAVTTLEPLVNQRGARVSAIETARYNLNNCRVYAPFGARVTNLTISEGAYAHIGQQVFTLIDARTWWAVANFREGQLQHIVPGMKADVYVLSKPSVSFPGVVESIGFGVTPDEDVVGRLSPGLPDVQRTLNWVHLASRYPVRVRVADAPADLLRVSESAVVVLRGL
ncbi:MAG TPA: HlyD family efflux transporter periplasmic adaptor subunit [Bryobacteraceae bacterium]|jgi:multidrug efflux system membrane fusion protein|nr:HlyD family efflux transporter periplasmic adaptor subunit [Bryobacteraceae bacterium]